MTVTDLAYTESVDGDSIGCVMVNVIASIIKYERQTS